MVKMQFSIFSFRCRNPFLGSIQFHWLSEVHDLCLSKVSVATDYSDSVPYSSCYASNQGYHPLEELKVCKRIRETKLSSAEIARTTVEANSSALLVFPRTVHSKPYEQISWAEFQYVVDDYGEYLISIEALVVFIYILIFFFLKILMMRTSYKIVEKVTLW
ncbi:uncharacterized protein LOC111307777 isoform X4 [Durio zibethinus]|uniref:Uncharacterized protein LOC111307777 isoform X4 n=1 Tax=Durio zibethinus TaxID=66656 RepID=A0A6P6AA34_DURZI|nr:uncharacterized protein LOC111307777 isoform X4 [Durio zibethinus]